MKLDEKKTDLNSQDKEWKCSSCETIFIMPDPPVNHCPECHSNLTFPLNPRKLDYKPVLEPERQCPECDTVMRFGFIVERNSPLSVLTLGEGIYWSPGEAGAIGKRVALKSYACPECGFVGLYVRRLKSDKNTILEAPTRENVF